jgi:hypothetical protein
MLGEGGTALSDLEAAARKFQADESREIDLRGLRRVLDSLEGTFCADARRSQVTGAHLADGNATVVTWLSRLCGMSLTSTADRLCVGTQLESLPKIAEALRTGEVSYQSTFALPPP